MYIYIYIYVSLKACLCTCIYRCCVIFPILRYKVCHVANAHILVRIEINIRNIYIYVSRYSFSKLCYGLVLKDVYVI